MAAHWLAELDGRRVTVEVPASSANLGAGYDCLGRRAGADQPDRARGPRLEPRRDRADRRRRGPQRADRGPRQPVRARPRGGARRGPRRAARRRRLADRDAQPDPAGARPRVVGGRDRRPASLAGNALARRAAVDTPTHAAASPRDDRGPPGQRGGGPARRVRRLGRDRPTASRRSGSMSPRDLRAVLFIPELRLPTDAMRKALPATVPLADAVANLGAVGGRRRRAGHRPLRPAGPADRRPAARAVPRGRLPAAAPAWSRRRATAGALGRLPVRRRLDDPRLRRLDGRDHPDRGRVRRRRRRLDLPGRVLVVEPRNAGARVARRPDRRRSGAAAASLGDEPQDLVPGRRAGVGELGRLAVEEAVRRARVGHEPVVDAGRRQRRVERRDRLGVIARSAPPNRPRTGAAIVAAPRRPAPGRRCATGRRACRTAR